MNCPSCEKKPLGFIHHFFKFGNVGFSKSLLGYFRCQYCGTLLKQQRYGIILPKFDIKFWLILPLLFLIVIFFPGQVTEFIQFLFPSLEMLTLTITYGLLLLVILSIAIVIMFRSTLAFMKFEAVNEAELSRTERTKIKPAGWIYLFLFLAVYLVGGYVLMKNLELSNREWIYIVGFIIYMLLLLACSAWIINKYSFTEIESE